MSLHGTNSEITLSTGSAETTGNIGGNLLEVLNHFIGSVKQGSISFYPNKGIFLEKDIKKNHQYNGSAFVIFNVS